MRPTRRWYGLTVVVLLGSADGLAAPDAGSDPRLTEAQAALDASLRFFEQGRYQDSAAKAEAAEKLRVAALGAGDPAVAECLTAEGDAYRMMGAYAQAESALQQALAILEAARGRDDPICASSLYGLAVVYVVQGQLAKAEPLARRSLALRERGFGKDHPKVADALNVLGEIARMSAKYADGEGLYLRSIAILEKAGGPKNPRLVSPLMNLALFYTEAALYDRAPPVFERALALVEEIHGKDHPTAGIVLMNMGGLYRALGQDERAEPLFERAQAILEHALGPKHPACAGNLGNLASVAIDQGRFDRAQSLLRQALEDQEAALGKGDPALGASLTGLGLVETRLGHYDAAEAAYRRALSIREAAQGPNHPLVAETLIDFADLDLHRGKYRDAEAHLRRAIAIDEATHGEDHYATAAATSTLAEVYQAEGQPERAAALYQLAIERFERSIGPSHPLITETLEHLAEVRLMQRRLPDALALYRRELDLSEGRLRREALGFSESRLATFLQFLSDGRDHLYSLVRSRPGNAEVRGLALAAALLFQGRSVEEAADASRAILRGLGAPDRDAFERLRSLRTRFAALAFDGQGELSSADYQRRLADLAAEGDALETDLARRSAPLRALAALSSPAEIVGKVAAALPRDGALVELMEYGDRPAAASAGRKEDVSPQRRFMAIILFPDGRTGAADLGPSAPIDAATARLRDALASQDASVRAAAEKVYRLAFLPLLPLLGKTRALFVVPDGQLALVPFDALHDGRQYLTDRFDITYLSAGRDLLLHVEAAPRSSSVVVIADPDYDAAAPGGSPDGGAPAIAGQRGYDVERFFTGDRGDLLKQHWGRLPGTRGEAEAIRHLLPETQVFLGAEASKERLLQLLTPDILHVATHGFFLEDAAPVTASRGFAAVEGDAVPQLPDPLLRSGLVLAGAKAGAGRLSESVVTALELSGLDLWGTELVVLSACDTGRGEVKLGQGVYGLRRALAVAGAETAIVSLWRVNDEVTRTMMERYYARLLAGGSRAAGLREAMRSIRAEHPHPHFWAPFIAVGRDAPIRRWARPAADAVP